MSSAILTIMNFKCMIVNYLLCLWNQKCTHGVGIELSILKEKEPNNEFMILKTGDEHRTFWQHVLPYKTAFLSCWPPLWSSGQSSWLQIHRPGFDSRHYQIFWEVVGGWYSDGLLTGRLGFNFEQVQEICLSTASIPALRPTEPRIQWIPGGGEGGGVLGKQSGRGMKLISHFHLVPFKNGGGLPQLSDASSWHDA
jgi:hypothetical protein